MRDLIDVTRFDFLSCDVAWKIQKSYGTELEHHPCCSSVQYSTFLCDCGAIETEFERLRKEQI